MTGANRGTGKAFADELLYCGATKVYAAVRDVATITQQFKTQGTEVVAVHVGPVDTDMQAGTDVAKTPPADVARSHEQ